MWVVKASTGNYLQDTVPNKSRWIGELKLAKRFDTAEAAKKEASQCTVAKARIVRIRKKSS